MDTIVLIMLLIYVLIILISILGLTSLSVAALIGAVLTAWFGIQYGVFDYEGALGFVDFQLLSLLIGTMIVVEVAKRGGLFNVFALYAIKSLEVTQVGFLFQFVLFLLSYQCFLVTRLQCYLSPPRL